MASSCDAVAKWTKNGSTADVKQASYQPQRAYTTRMSDICATLDVVWEGPVPSRGPNAHPIGRADMSPTRERAQALPYVSGSTLTKSARTYGRELVSAVTADAVRAASAITTFAVAVMLSAVRPASSR